MNCAALPADLLESELFGYEAGAFTGAVRGKPGKFELANHGTILLDELGEMSPALQAKLLHVLQDGEYSRLGGRTTVKADVRVLAATNIDMQKAIAQKTFREDLYYRLNAFTINIPPLRERREEIGPLVKNFMERFSEKYSQEPLAQSALSSGRACGITGRVTCVSLGISSNATLCFAMRPWPYQSSKKRVKLSA